MSVSMAIVDFIPVVLFIVAGIVWIQDLYNKMGKGTFAVFSAGVLVIMISGVYKASWKMLYALELFDFAALNRAYFPMQTTGFVLTAIGLLMMLSVPREKTGMYAIAALPVYESSMPFVIFTVLGTAGICGSLAVIAARMKKKLAVLLFVLAFVFMLAMGYLSSQDFTQASMHWIAQCTNIIGQGSLLAGTLVLHKAGLAAPDSLQKVKA